LYCLDTSAILEGRVRTYPPKTFITLWGKIELTIEKGLIVAPAEVLVELAKKEDSVFEWAKGHNNLNIPLTTDIQLAAKEVLRQFSRLVDSRKTSSQADPFVIALAMIEKRAVVTGEKNDGTPDKPKIPFVCASLGVKCINFLEMIQDQDWTF